MEVPSTPPTRLDPFSSPARGVGWSPDVSVSLFRGISSDSSVSQPINDVESALNLDVSPVRRAGITQLVPPGPFTPHASRTLRRGTSFQSYASFLSDDLARFPASSPSRSVIVRSPSLPPINFFFYAPEPDTNELDKRCQLASPASEPMHHHSPSRPSVPPSTPAAPVSSIVDISSPIFPAPASPPLFAANLSASAHTLSYYGYSSPGFPSQIGPLPPSSPIPYTSSPFDDDPFFVRPSSHDSGKSPVTTGTLAQLEGTSTSSYALPKFEPGYVPRSSRLAHKRVQYRPGFNTANGVAKPSRVKGKAATRGRKSKYNFPSDAHLFDQPSLEPGASPSSDAPVEYIWSPSLMHTPSHASLVQNVCASSTVPPAPLSSPISSSQFMFPTPAGTFPLMTPSLVHYAATPSTIDTLATPANTSLLDPAEISDSPFTLRTQRRPILRFPAPSPVSIPSTIQNSMEHGVQDMCHEETSKTQSESKEHASHGEQDLAELDLRPRQSKGVFREDAQNLQSGKRTKVMSNESKVEAIAQVESRTIEPEPKVPLLDIIIDRPTRSRTRAMVELMTADSNVASSRHEPSIMAPRARSNRRSAGRSVKGKAAGRPRSKAGFKSEDKAFEECLGLPEGDVNILENEVEEGSITKAEGSSRSTASAAKRISPSELLPRPSKSIIFRADGSITRRTFPKSFPINEKYAKWYRRFPVPAYFQENDPAKAFVLGDGAPKSVDMQPHPAGPRLTPNRAQHLNLYTPRFVRGKSHEKFGLCTICIEPLWRGGEGKAVLLNTKISAYNYHMQYYHGICAQTGLPFSPPTAFRLGSRKAANPQEKTEIEEGKCHSCKKWVPVDSVKHLDALVPELFWWKHAASCHGRTRVEGDQDPYLEDAIYLKVVEYHIKTDDKAAKNVEGNQQEGRVISAPAEDARVDAYPGPGSASLDAFHEHPEVKLESHSLRGDDVRLEDTGITSTNVSGPMDSDSDLTDLEDDTDT
ncbi:hypothetical protein RhiLY_08917 [Ceratobasidium sp. AG-Ba]|nr:hypothetical protein RhiLY_08917 [Ceratobasidium sp. AG-Ba]